MKKILFLLLAVFISVATSLQTKAQETSAIDKLPLHIEVAFNSGTNSHQLSPMGVVAELNYHLTDRFSIRAVSNSTYFIPKEGVTKDYNWTYNLGGGVGYKFDTDNYFSWEARAFVTTSLNSSLYKNTSYNIGLYLYGKTQWHKIVPLIGLGYNFKDYKSHDLKSYNGAYITLGVRF